MKPELASPNVLWTLGSILSLLALATVSKKIVQRINPRIDLSLLAHYINTWWIIVIPLALAIAASKRLSIILFAFVSFMTLKEFFSIIPIRRTDRRVLFWAYLTIPVQYYWISKDWFEMFAIFIPVIVFLILPIRVILIGDISGLVKTTGVIQWGLMTTVFGISHLAYLLVLPPKYNPNGGGAGFVLYLILLNQLNDIAHAIFGKVLGHLSVFPNSRSQKTYEGLVFATSLTVFLSLLLSQLLTPLTHIESVLAGLVIGLGGVIGDVIMSGLKQDLGIKQNNSNEQTYTRILDNMDSLMYTAPLFFYFLKIT
jgi:phosphatidate cytidylyltransferase